MCVCVGCVIFDVACMSAWVESVGPHTCRLHKIETGLAVGEVKLYGFMDEKSREKVW